MFSPKFLVLYIFIVSVAYTQFRGKVRLKFFRQLINHSTIMAPVNAIMYLFSAIPNKPFFDLKAFPELAELSDNWQTIREEAVKLLEQSHIKVSENNDDMGFNSFFKRGWKRFYLKWYQDPLPSAQMLCPKTVELLKKVPSVKGAMFTLLPKGGQLKQHRDPYAGSIRYHLGLVTPNSEKCRIYVDGIPYSWKDGEGVLFDETYIHSAKNETDIDRIILLCDVERPMRNRIATTINRVFSKYVVAEATTKNLDIDRVGLLNKIYSQYHRLAGVLNQLKKKNKYVYKIVQLSLIGGLVYLFFF
jgi:beta-hydroxylase